MDGRRIAIAAGIALLLAADSTRASSDEAWKQFANDVKVKCTAAAGDRIARPRVVVDPTGSEHYGLALVGGTPRGAKATVTFICVYDKQQRKAEIGSELAADQVGIAPTGGRPIKAK